MHACKPYYAMELAGVTIPGQRLHRSCKEVSWQAAPLCRHTGLNLAGWMQQAGCLTLPESYK